MTDHWFDVQVFAGKYSMEGVWVERGKSRKILRNSKVSKSGVKILKKMKKMKK